MKRILSALVFLILFSCDKQDDIVDPIDPMNSTDVVTTLGGTRNDAAQSVVATSDGGFAVLGFTQSMDGNVSDKSDESFDYWLLKFDAERNLQWDKTYGGSGDDGGR